MLVRRRALERCILNILHYLAHRALVIRVQLNLLVIYREGSVSTRLRLCAAYGRFSTLYGSLHVAGGIEQAAACVWRWHGPGDLFARQQNAAYAQAARRVVVTRSIFLAASCASDSSGPAVASSSWFLTKICTVTCH